MIKVSNDFLLTLNSRTDFKQKAVITLKDGTILNESILGPHTFTVSNNYVTDSAGTSAIPIGIALEKTIQLEFVNYIDATHTFDIYDFADAKIHLYLSYVVDEHDENGMVTGETVEEIVDYGNYTTLEVEYHESTITITAVDDMYKADEVFVTALDFPCTAKELLFDICNTLDFSTEALNDFPNADFVIKNDSFASSNDSITFRNVIGYIAGIAGGNARFDFSGVLHIIPYDFKTLGADFNSLDGGTFVNWDLYDDDVDGGKNEVWTGSVKLATTEVYDAMFRPASEIVYYGTSGSSSLSTGAVSTLASDNLTSDFFSYLDGYIDDTTGSVVFNSANTSTQWVSSIVSAPISVDSNTDYYANVASAYKVYYYTESGNYVGFKTLYAKADKKAVLLKFKTPETAKKIRVVIRTIYPRTSIRIYLRTINYTAYIGKSGSISEVNNTDRIEVSPRSAGVALYKTGNVRDELHVVRFDSIKTQNDNCLAWVVHRIEHTGTSTNRVLAVPVIERIENPELLQSSLPIPHTAPMTFRNYTRFTTTPNDVDVYYFSEKSFNYDSGEFSDAYRVLESWDSLTVTGRDDVIITGVKTTYTVKEDGKESQKTLLVGTDDYAVSIDNPLISGNEQDALNRIGAVMIGGSMHPFSGDYLANPTLEFMDKVYVVDRKGNAYFTILTDVNFAFMGKTTYSNSAESAVRNSSKYLRSKTV